MKLQFELLSDEQINKIHSASLDVLENTGMKLESQEMLDALEKAGCQVDKSNQCVRFPTGIIESAIETNKKVVSQRGLPLLNGVTSEKIATDKISAKVSGGCELLFDWKTQTIKEPGYGELLNSIRIGQMMDEVGFVGNPVVLRKDIEGKTIDEKMRRVETAALIAKNTEKVGSMEVWDERELDIFLEMAMVIRGSKEAYDKKPILLTAKETISPLFLDKDAARILLGMAKRQLPCTIIPMPITGMSAPVKKLGPVIVANAEILGVIAAINAVYPETPVGGGTISGILDMQTTAASFSAPEAILQDIAIAEVHERLYGLNYLLGTGYTDAKFPGRQILAEKTMKFLLTYLSGRTSYPVGLINAGSVFSIEQTLVDVEICRYIHSFFENPFDFDSIETIAEVIKEVGIRGEALSHPHTLGNFRENWFPKLMDRTAFKDLKQSADNDIYLRAHSEVNRTLSSDSFYEIEEDKGREIDNIVKKAREILA